MGEVEYLYTNSCQWDPGGVISLHILSATHTGRAAFWDFGKSPPYRDADNIWKSEDGMARQDSRNINRAQTVMDKGN